MARTVLEETIKANAKAQTKAIKITEPVSKLKRALRPTVKKTKAVFKKAPKNAAKSNKVKSTKSAEDLSKSDMVTFSFLLSTFLDRTGNLLLKVIL